MWAPNAMPRGSRKLGSAISYTSTPRRDGEIPISCVLTAASVHDADPAKSPIPLATITAGRVTNLYDI